MVWVIITFVGLIASIITIYEFLVKRCNKNDSSVAQSSTPAFHAVIKCRYFKDYDRQSYLVFSNEGKCAAYNIIIDGLDKFFVHPKGQIPHVLDVNDEFKLLLYLIKGESNSIMNLSVSWDDNAYNH